MKNVSIHITPTKKWSRETAKSFKIWIDNSLDLGWKKEDIIFITNFPYEYNGIKSTIVDEANFCPFRPGSSKTCEVTRFLANVPNDNTIYWIHDSDAYQDNVITEKELELDDYDVGFTTYGWSPKWCLGSYFAKKASKDIFDDIKKVTYRIRDEDERAIFRLTKVNYNNINSRIKAMNITYNFGQRKIPINYELATKPLKVLHFRPQSQGFDNIGQFIYGKNRLNMPLMSKRLARIFKYHRMC